MIYLEHVLSATSGTLLRVGKQTRFDTFNQDSRQLIPGELFVAVRGERGDGHDFLQDAIQRGAAGLLIEGRALQGFSDEQRATLQDANVTTIVVEETRLALQQYARAILRRWQPTVIAVTGSTGKTSVKEAIAAVLSQSFAVFKSWQNYNDLLGIPLSLGRLEERHEFAILELACDHPGEIQQLCQITRPTIGVLTNISASHLQYFGTVERLAEELGNLLACLPPEGAAIVNGDDALIRTLLPACRAPVHAFWPSRVQNVQVGWGGIRGDYPLEEQRDFVGGETAQTRATGRAPINRAVGTPTIHVSSRLLGAHHFTTMLAAATVGRYCGLSQGEIERGLADVRPMPGRLRPLDGIEGARLLDDTHNAVPASMRAGLETLRTLPAHPRIAILGDMLRLGAMEEEAHREAGLLASRCADYLIVRGERAILAAEAARRAGMPEDHIIITSTHDDAAQAARAALATQPGRTTSDDTSDGRPSILIKGSEETRMERVTERLMAYPERAREELVRQTPGWKQIVVTRPRRPTWLEVDLSAIANNTRQIREIIGSGVRLLATLKADAYGHGALKVAPAALHNGADMLGVATVSEASPLREAGIGAPILVFGYVPPWQMREAVHLELTVTLYSLEAAQALSRAALALKKSARVHVKVDTGMGRLGVRFEQMDEVMKLVRAIHELPGLELEGIFTHFAMADTHDQRHARLQLARFEEVLQVLEQQHLRPPLAHAANSAAMLSLPEARFDMVRPGIALYGLDPSPEVRLPAAFRPALSFKTQVAQVKTIPAGECISYGCTYYAEQDMTVAVLPVGYADGFRRAPRNWGAVLLRGQEAPLLGRVCMDQCIIDVSHIPRARAGDEVVLIGHQGQASLTAEQVAERLGTINYEVVSEILARVPRVD